MTDNSKEMAGAGWSGDDTKATPLIRPQAEVGQQPSDAIQSGWLPSVPTLMASLQTELQLPRRGEL